MTRAMMTALFAGTVFGAGLALSGMVDPHRVRGFLDIGGAWDPTLAFVMAGALVPMAIGWRLQRGLAKPLAADRFDLPATNPIDRRVILGSALFGIGWAVSGLCPGPGIADLVLDPPRALLFVSAMLGGMGVHRLALARRPASDAVTRHA